jgi:hypothetical protein
MCEEQSVFIGMPIIGLYSNILKSLESLSHFFRTENAHGSTHP